MRNFLYVWIIVLIVLSACTTAVPESAATDQPPLIIRVAFPSTIDINDVAALLAFEKLAAEGIAVVPTFYAQAELAVTAVATGQAELGVGSATVWLSAILQDAPIVGLMEQNSNSWSLMAVNSIQSCQDLDGKRTAIHSEGAVSTAMLHAYVALNCPGAEPEYLIIPGSENRAAALMAGEIDATPSELIDALSIQALRPGEFQVISNFAVDLPGLYTTGVWVDREFLQEHPDQIRSFLRALLEIHRQINDDPEWFSGQVTRFLDFEDEELALLPEIIAALLAVDNYPLNGGIDLAGAQYTIDFFTASGALTAGLTADKVYDLSHLEAVLDEIGRR